MATLVSGLVLLKDVYDKLVSFVFQNKLIIFPFSNAFLLNKLLNK